MDFDRVRNPEQRKIRVQQIKDAATKLFDTKLFHEITLADIAKETSFTRGNLYKYITSKEEIFLLVTVDEMMDWVADLDRHIDGDMTERIDDFAKTWATVTHKHKRFMKLISLLCTIIEQNVTLEKLIDFKKEIGKASVGMYSLVKKAFPTWNDHKAIQFINMQQYYATGLFPYTSPTEMQKQAVEASNINFQFPDFMESLSEFIVRIVKSLNLE